MLDPLIEREAMWISFSSRSAFALRIFAGGINGITGESRTAPQGKDGDRKQDYLVLPDQPWLDGIAVRPGIIRQFVAVPSGSGYSIEHQITGADTVGGVQFEVIPRNPNVGNGSTPVFVKLLSGDTLTCKVELSSKVSDLLELLIASEGSEAEGKKISFGDKTLEDDKTLSECGVKESSNLELGYPDYSRGLAAEGMASSGMLFGEGMPLMMKSAPMAMVASADSAPSQSSAAPGGAAPVVQSMAMGAGGQIEQKVYEDKHPPDFWDPSRATAINLHLLDSASFEEVTGLAVPPTPVSMETYVSYGYPMFALADEDKGAVSGEGGAFKDVKSVSEIDAMRGVTAGGDFDPNKPQACARCETRLREIL